MAKYDDLQEQLGGLDPFDVPTPGSSLTASPETPAPFEQPPKMVDQEEAVDDIFMRLTDSKNIDSVLDLMRDEVPVEDIAQVVLFEGFRQGQFTPDLMLTLIEPTIYMLLYLADYANIDNVKLYPEGDGPAESMGPIPRPDIEVPADKADVEGMLTVEGKKIARPASVKPSLLASLQQKATIGEQV